MSNHTPGPWDTTDHGDKRHKEFAIMAAGGKIASVFAGFGAHFDWPTSGANAHLIAAAPDLLAYAEKELSWLLHIQEQISHPQVKIGVKQAIKSAQAIIAQATGGES